MNPAASTDLETSIWKTSERKEAERLFQIVLNGATPSEKADALSSLKCRLANIQDPALTKETARALKRLGLVKSQKIFESEVEAVSLNPFAEKSEKPSKKEAVLTMTGPGVIDVVSFSGRPSFLMKKGAGLEAGLEIVPVFENDGITCTPPSENQIPWLLPRGEEILSFHDLQAELSPAEQNAALWDDLVAYHRSISELPGDAFYDLFAAWDFHTYLTEKIQYSPIICLFAVPERGKSRTGKSLIYVARNGIHVESLRDAYLVRIARDLQAAVFFDVLDLWKKAEKNGTEDILLHRFEKGASVPRVLYPEKGPHKDIVYYSIFGPTVIGTNEAVHKILETRAVQLAMPDSTMRFENNVTPELALPLKERLILFRANYLDASLPECEKPAAGRLGDILKPIRQIIRLVRPDREAAFLELVKEIETSRLIDKSDSLEGQILNTLSQLKDKVEFCVFRREFPVIPGISFHSFRS